MSRPYVPHPRRKEGVQEDVDLSPFLPPPLETCRDPGNGHGLCVTTCLGRVTLKVRGEG